ISEATYQKVAGQIEIEALGEKVLKGIPDPVVTYRVTGEKRFGSRFRASAQQRLQALIGRTEEIARLERHWQNACAGEGQLVILSGEAGIGKSRVTQELLDSLDKDSGGAAMQGSDSSQASSTRLWLFQCSPHQMASPLYPILNAIENEALAGASDDSASLTHLSNWIEGQGHKEKAPDVAVLAGLIGLPGGLAQVPVTAVQTLMNWMVLRLSQPRPGRMHLVVFEDVHWADPTTLLVVRQIVAAISNQRVMVLLTARPTFTETFQADASVSIVALNRMTRDDVTAMIGRHLTVQFVVPPYLVELIAEKSDGVPLYVEEITKAVLPPADNPRAAAAWFRDAQRQNIEVPESLQDSLLARLDRTGSGKDLAQAAACIGRDFSVDQLCAVGKLPIDTVLSVLNGLVEAEVVFPASELGPSVYRFKHALICDAAYDSQLRDLRRERHQLMVDYLRSSDNPGAEIPEVMAHHCELAGDQVGALKYWVQAARRGVDAGALNEAASHFRRALALCDAPEMIDARPANALLGDDEGDDLTGLRIRLRIELSAILPDLAGQGNPESETLSHTAAKLAAQTGRINDQFRAVAIYAFNQMYLGKLNDAVAALDSLPDTKLLVLSDRTRVDYLAACHFARLPTPHGEPYLGRAIDATNIARRLLSAQPDSYVLTRRTAEILDWQYAHFEWTGDFHACD
ncbi:MAG: AAA family ATPase, partial [Sulfitobacter sp.]